MREILFRGKRYDNGKWAEGFLFEQHGDCVVWVCISSSPLCANDYSDILGDWCCVIPETVGQYTGLTDKNGKKIFEGDIVRADDYVFSVKYGKCGGTPNADNYGYMGFYLDAVSEGTKLCAYYGLRDDICYFTDIEVIGNINDNPELMKGVE